MTQPLPMLIRVVVADVDTDEINGILALLGQDPHITVVGTATEPGALLALHRLDPDIILLSPRLAPDGITRLIRQLIELVPHTQVLLMTGTPEQLDVPGMMLAGARGLLPRPLGADMLLGSIRDVMQAEAGRRQRLRELAETRRTRGAQGRVTAFFSPKGGVGCTLLACNLGIALQWATKTPTALVDYSLQFGTVGTTLNLQSTHTVSELLPHYDALDSTILDDVLVTHPSGMRVLLAPGRLDDLELVTTEALVGVLAALRSQYRHILVDLWHAAEDATMGVMEAADTVLLVTTPEIPALYTVRRFLELLKEYPQVRDKVQLVVNRLPSRGGVDQRQIEQSLGLPVIAAIPSDGYLMLTTVNEGVPLVQKNANSGFARAMNNLATTLVGDAAADAEAAEPARNRRFTLSRRRT